MGIAGVELVQDLNRQFSDNRGYFLETFKAGKWPDMVQTNVSYSHANVVRGLHYQLNPEAQGKIVQVVAGRILDVVVDIRSESPTFGRVETYELTPGSGVLIIDKNCAHGFYTLEPSVVMYHCTKEYSPGLERSINPLSEGLYLPWTGKQDLVVSDKDLKAPTWREYVQKLIDNPGSITV